MLEPYQRRGLARSRDGAVQHGRWRGGGAERGAVCVPVHVRSSVYRQTMNGRKARIRGRRLENGSLLKPTEGATTKNALPPMVVLPLI